MSAEPTLRLIVVDDEEPGRINLRYALAEHPRWRLAGECADAGAARALLAGGEIDLVLLDVHMPGDSGMQLARELCRMAAPPLVIFVTAHQSHALEAFAVEALDYLLKPIDDARLAQALRRAEAMLAQRPSPEAPADYWTQLEVRSIGMTECVRLDQVRWLGAAGNYVALHLAQRSVLHRVAIGKLARHLDPAIFIRVHRSALVRLDQLEALAVEDDGGVVAVLRGGDRVGVSVRHVQAVRLRMASR